MHKCPDLKNLRILHYPHPALRDHAKRVKEQGHFLQEMAERMVELMREANGYALAATQVGWPYRFVVISEERQSEKVHAFINPVIVSREGRLMEEEGCLSVPGLFAKVRRAGKVRARATLLNGESVELEAEGLAARAWQHELDHLDGTLFVDRLGPTAKLLIASRLREMERLFEETRTGLSADRAGRPDDKA